MRSSMLNAIWRSPRARKNRQPGVRDECRRRRPRAHVFCAPSSGTRARARNARLSARYVGERHHFNATIARARATATTRRSPSTASCCKFERNDQFYRRARKRLMRERRGAKEQKQTRRDRISRRTASGGIVTAAAVVLLTCAARATTRTGASTVDHRLGLPS